MDSRIGELRCKEVVNVNDGSRYGYVADAEVDLETGKIRTLIVPGRLRMLGLLGREADRIFRWSSVRHFGEDIILVEDSPQSDGSRWRGRNRGERGN